MCCISLVLHPPTYAIISAQKVPVKACITTKPSTIIGPYIRDVKILSVGQENKLVLLNLLLSFWFENPLAPKTCLWWVCNNIQDLDSVHVEYIFFTVIYLEWVYPRSRGSCPGKDASWYTSAVVWWSSVLSPDRRGTGFWQGTEEYICLLCQSTNLPLCSAQRRSIYKVDSHRKKM